MYNKERGVWEIDDSEPLKYIGEEIDEEDLKRKAKMRKKQLLKMLNGKEGAFRDGER